MLGIKIYGALWTGGKTEDFCLVPFGDSPFFCLHPNATAILKGGFSMSKRLMRIVAIAACFSILFLSIPAVSSAKVKIIDESLKFDIFKHWRLFLSFLPIFSPVFDQNVQPDSAKDEKVIEQDSSSQKIKVTGTLSSVAPPRTGDDDD